MNLRPTSKVLKETNRRFRESMKLDLPGALLVTLIAAVILILAASGGYLVGMRRQASELKAANAMLGRQLDALDLLNRDEPLKAMFASFAAISREEKKYHQYLVSRFRLSERESRDVWEILRELEPYFAGVAEFDILMRTEGIGVVDFNALKDAVDRAFEATASTLCTYLKVRCLRGVLPHEADLIDATTEGLPTVRPAEAAKPTQQAGGGCSRPRLFLNLSICGQVFSTQYTLSDV